MSHKSVTFYESPLLLAASQKVLTPCSLIMMNF